MLLLGTVLGGPVWAARFDYPAVVGDRRAELTWAADTAPDSMPDPYYSGNTVLKLRGAPLTHIHGAHAVQAVTFTADGTEVYSYAATEPTVQHWRILNGTLLDTLGRAFLVAPGTEPVALSLHGTGNRLLALVTTPADTAKVEYWNLSVSNRMGTVLNLPGAPFSGARFLPAIGDSSDLTFATLGTDNFVRFWRRRTTTGLPDSASLAFQLPEGVSQPIFEVGRLRDNRRPLAIGTQSGTVYVYDVAGAREVRLATLTGHAGAIRQIVISRDGRRITTGDDTGQIRTWTLPSGDPILTLDTGRPLLSLDVLVLDAFPFGELLVIGQAPADGSTGAEIALYSGADGTSYRRAKFLDVPLGTMALAADPRQPTVVIGDSGGRFTLVRAGLCSLTLDKRCFGGYRVWRLPSTDPDDPGRRLLRVFEYGDSTWRFSAADGTVRRFSDPDSVLLRVFPPSPGQENGPVEPVVVTGPHNGVPYYYSVSRFDVVNLNGSRFVVDLNTITEGFYREPGQTAPLAISPYPVPRTEAPFLGDVYVVPNPFERGKVSSRWGSGAEKVEFRGLPQDATIRIYSLGGDLVRVLEHAPGRGSDPQAVDPRGSESWDLRSASGRSVAPGVYVYQIEVSTGEVIQGYLTLVL